MAVKTPKEFEKAMKEIYPINPVFGVLCDTANNHIMADELMCEILIDLGYGEGVQPFTKAKKYYD